MPTLAERWRRARAREVGGKGYFYLTPALLALFKTYKAEAEAYVQGTVLDAGAGAGAWAPLLRPRARRLVAADVAPVAGVGADLKALPFRDSAFDAVFCSQVLEHDREPERVVAELRRVLKPGGTAIITAPHLSRLHDEPHDYYRFTAEGLRYLAETAGLAVVNTARCGGLLCFVVHNLATAAVAVAAAVPAGRALAAGLAKLASPAVLALDNLVDRRGRFALSWMLIARKDER